MTSARSSRIGALAWYEFVDSEANIADGGSTWAEADLQSEAEPLRPVRFRIPWRWNGAPARLQSRAVDTAGNVQPTRSAALAGRAPTAFYHYNGIQTWAVDDSGRVRNVHA